MPLAHLVQDIGPDGDAHLAQVRLAEQVHVGPRLADADDRDRRVLLEDQRLSPAYSLTSGASILAVR